MKTAAIISALTLLLAQGLPLSRSFKGKEDARLHDVPSEHVTVSAIPDAGARKTVYAWPKPVAGDLLLDFIAMEHGTYSVELINSAGKTESLTVIQVTPELQKETIKLDEFAAGLYLVKITQRSSGKIKSFTVAKPK